MKVSGIELRTRAESKDGEKFAVMDITPAIASAWLSTMHWNRKPTEQRVKKYADEMKRGRWEVNGESIKVDSEGKMFDGQHRCMAVVESGVTIKSAVFFGSKPETLFTIDTGKSRNMANILDMMGNKNCTALAAAVRYCYLWDRFKSFNSPNGRDPGAIPTHQELLEYLNRNSGIQDAVARVSLKASGKSRFLSGGFGGAIFYILGRIDHEEADRFFDALNRGVNLAEDSPIFHLRTQLVDRMTGRRKMTIQEIVAYTFKAWNFWREGRPCKLLIVRLGGSKPEPFPVPK